MSLRNVKANPSELVRTHLGTYRDASTGRWRWQDHFLFEVVPLIAGGLSIAFDVRLRVAASVGLLTVCGLLSALLFGVMLQISDRAMEWADSAPLPGPETSAHATFLSEIAANSGYASLVCITAAIIFVGASVGNGLFLRICSGLGIALGLHLVLVVLMVMKRVFGLTQGRLNRARSGADRETGMRERRAS
jgi:hypothetical protein